MTLQKIDAGIYVEPGTRDNIARLDSVIFDCDGVLIDVSRSYDLAIQKTVDFVTGRFASIRADPVTPAMIDSLKRSGGFNDEVDVTYALILAAVASQKTGKSFDGMVAELAARADATGIRSVERHLDDLQVDLSEIKSRMSYPAERFASPLSSIFDEMFYGRELYGRLYKREPEFYMGRGLIENDVLLINKDFLGRMRERFGRKMAIVTGRGSVSASHSLGDLYSEFDLASSKFLEDEPREMAKPNPLSLLSAIRGMEAVHPLFVGDSMEDLIMARRAGESGHPTLFCGIYGTSKEPGEKLAFFGQKGADIVLESASLLPKTLNLVRA